MIPYLLRDTTFLLCMAASLLVFIACGLVILNDLFVGREDRKALEQFSREWTQSFGASSAQRRFMERMESRSRTLEEGRPNAVLTARSGMLRTQQALEEAVAILEQNMVEMGERTGVAAEEASRAMAALSEAWSASPMVGHWDINGRMIVERERPPFPGRPAEQAVAPAPEPPPASGGRRFGFRRR